MLINISPGYVVIRRIISWGGVGEWEGDRRNGYGRLTGKVIFREKQKIRRLLLSSIFFQHLSKPQIYIYICRSVFKT